MLIVFLLSFQIQVSQLFRLSIRLGTERIEVQIYFFSFKKCCNNIFRFTTEVTDEKLAKLVAELREKTNYAIVIVNDGSDADRMPLFGRLAGAATVLHHEVNRGKGAALKTALRYIQAHSDRAEGVITVDADGQHLVEDIVRVSEDWAAHPNALVLGSRQFTGRVPFKSRAGNAITRFVFHISTGVKVFDTQTGLRAFSVGRIPMMLNMRGDRYEYEINVLLYATRHRVPIREVWIETVYIDDNASSHFHPVRDAWRIYKMILLFVASSLASFLIDVCAFRLLRMLFPGWGKLFAEVAARVISSICNYCINREIVFEGKNRSSIVRYYVLAIGILALDYGILSLLTLLMPELWAKIFAGMLVYPISFYFQRRFVFVTKDEEELDAET